MWCTPTARASHTQKEQKQHAHDTTNKHAQRQQHKAELTPKAALHCQPPHNVLLSSLVCHHVFTSPACLAISMPPLSGQMATKANRRASGTAPSQPPIEYDAELCPTKDYFNETLGLCPTKLCFTFREKESNRCHESRKSNQ
jgi:hypothetical protein